MENLTAEQKIRWQSLLVALLALDMAGENVDIMQCECGALKIEGNSGQVQWNPVTSSWVFDGADGSEMYV